MTSMEKLLNNQLTLKILLVLATFLAAWIGASANLNTDWNWYENLQKSNLNPPNYLFGIVWPILYFLMAIVSFRQAQVIYKWYLIQLFLNCIWPWLFFSLQQPEIAFANIFALIMVNIKIMLIFKSQKSWFDFVMYLPYLLWISFASLLNISIVLLN